MTAKRVCRVAVINSNTDVAEALSHALTEAECIVINGYLPNFKRGLEDISNFLKEHRVDVILFDVSIPFKENWNFFQTVKKLREAKKIPFVLTTTNKRALKDKIGRNGAYELTEKPFELEELIERVKNKCKLS